MSLESVNGGDRVDSGVWQIPRSDWMLLQDAEGLGDPANQTLHQPDVPPRGPRGSEIPSEWPRHSYSSESMQRKRTQAVRCTVLAEGPIAAMAVRLPIWPIRVRPLPTGILPRYDAQGNTWALSLKITWLPHHGISLATVYLSQFPDPGFQIPNG